LGPYLTGPDPDSVAETAPSAAAPPFHRLEAPYAAVSFGSAVAEKERAEKEKGVHDVLLWLECEPAVFLAVLPAVPLAYESVVRGGKSVKKSVQKMDDALFLPSVGIAWLPEETVPEEAADPGRPVMGLVRFAEEATH